MRAGKEDFMRKTGTKKAAQGGPRGPKRGTIVIEGRESGLIQSAAHIPPRAKWWRRLRGTTCGDHAVKRQKFMQKARKLRVRGPLETLRSTCGHQNWVRKPRDPIGDDFWSIWGGPRGVHFRPKFAPVSKKTFQNHVS